jgi:hypothetical protein
MGSRCCLSIPSGRQQKSGTGHWRQRMKLVFYVGVQACLLLGGAGVDSVVQVGG